MTLTAHATAQDLPRRQVGRLARSARRRQPRRPGDAGGRDVQRHRGAVRGGGHGGRRRVRAHEGAAGLRARPRPARDQRRDQGAARGDRPDPQPRGRQADPRRARRGRPGRRSPSGSAPRRRSGCTARRSRSTCMPASKGRMGITRRFPIGPVAGDQPVQLPAQPRGAQARAGDRRGLLDRAQAAVEGPADDAHGRRDHRRRRAARRGRSASCR